MESNRPKIKLSTLRFINVEALLQTNTDIKFWNVKTSGKDFVYKQKQK